LYCHHHHHHRHNHPSSNSRIPLQLKFIYSNNTFELRCINVIIVIIIFIIIITIIIRHQLGRNRPVSASSVGVFKGLPSRLRPLGLQFSITFAILLLFILVARRSQFNLYRLSFSSAGSTVKSSKISSLLL